MAGTPHPNDRRRTAELLGFSGAIENAMDAVSSKDHLQETVAACAICMSTVSRMAEELVLWSSAEFALVRLAEQHTTSSSIMPQTRNPDGAELIRGEAGTIFGFLQALLTLTKGLPLAYNRDLQQERKPVVETVIRSTAAVRLMSAMWRDLEIHTERFEAELFGDLCLATELADFLVNHGVPFREAHLNAARVIAAGMKDLGLMKGDTEEAVQAGAHAMFFQCGTGHMMGLDVHDMEDLGEVWVGYDGQPKSTLFGLKSLRLARPLEPGFVVTVEPGIYMIPQLMDLWRGEKRFEQFLVFDEIDKWRDFGGIRNEEDFLITPEGHRRLGPPKPLTTDEVEAFGA